MPALPREEVAHLARLARIDMPDAELDHLADQLTAIVDAVASVTGAVAAAERATGEPVPATSHPVPLTNVTRPDVVHGVLTAADALAAAPEAEDDKFRVPRILGEDA
ncbi:aspartyl/glutamyl-tRNA(Asn/Gln) amidotransferase subunit C [Quadrisphaera granulorum]|uniref:Aspartyl/glutamyl-tRNA(Asn/Gln) amidotransferase subunit C n=1 Tax=Quadrisphaera granulorum TaxID=317664 RepID=A0A316AG40_9ACTN|nr:Asp-tRNA(Asn)/Glu-tRNA(Gln) amidotransferase subunit GatC [Quadrisphaera granulorum]PWJ56319.1 aspartyl/glutamyl-tRNA(Asn/Gln) amidotransferase subunit C [Quadrisphaera granulorum]SZE94953.1 aspartyl/glutamyl-tRNA(Asn/Gln) amidotransferase subunit C [Quadrisphaera granulorum]